ncbi:hypothetical protein WISP_79606 [Willisornis vidua]|uniref:Uncharacterized protein n=1 Tax=Willisornis vidua TaxID=1566151 RepID=A0ABQ9D658_9PASS|nr:hypothetical protein WISP_79606 [Willisornis vidua]
MVFPGEQSCLFRQCDRCPASVPVLILPVELDRALSQTEISLEMLPVEPDRARPGAAAHGAGQSQAWSCCPWSRTEPGLELLPVEPDRARPGAAARGAGQSQAWSCCLWSRTEAGLELDRAWSCCPRSRRFGFCLQLPVWHLQLPVWHQQCPCGISSSGIPPPTSSRSNKEQHSTETPELVLPAGSVRPSESLSVYCRLCAVCL